MKTLNIPFKVAPKVRLTTIGTETTGILELPSKLFLTVIEKMAIEQAGLVNIQKEVATLAKTITDELNKSPYKAKDAKRVNLVQVNDAIARRLNGSTDKDDADNALIGEFLTQLIDLKELATKASNQKIKVYAHTMAKYRLDLDCTIEQLEDAIGESLLTSLGLFGIYEEMGAVYKQTPEDDEPEEKKPQEATEEDLLK